MPAAAPVLNPPDDDSVVALAVGDMTMDELGDAIADVDAEEEAVVVGLAAWGGND